MLNVFLAFIGQLNLHRPTNACALCLTRIPSLGLDNSDPSVGPLAGTSLRLCNLDGNGKKADYSGSQAQTSCAWCKECDMRIDLNLRNNNRDEEVMTVSKKWMQVVKLISVAEGSKHWQAKIENCPDE